MFKTLIALLFAFTCINAQADTVAAPQWELGGGSNVSFNTHSYGSVNGVSNSSSNYRTFNITGEVGYFVMPQVEVEMNIAATFLNKNGATTSAWPILVGLVYNLDANAVNSIFVEALAGLTFNENGPGVANPNYSQFTYLFGAGKRFAITNSVSFKPEITWGGMASKTVTVGSSSATVASLTGWGFIPVQFSFIW
jgi:hypothetical protein